MNLCWWYITPIMILYCFRIVSGSKYTARSRHLVPDSEETVPDQVDPWAEGEPTCEQLKRLWLLSRRQARAAEITNEIPMHDPFPAVIPFASSTEPSRPSTTDGQVYGKIIYAPREEPVRQRPMERLRSFVSGSRSQRRLSYVDSSRMSKGFQRNRPSRDNMRKLFDDRTMALQTVETQNPKGGFNRLRHVLRSPNVDFSYQHRNTAFGSGHIPFQDVADEFSDEDNERLINMIKRYETNKKHAAVVKRLIERIQELPPREKQMLKRILEERTENRRQLRRQRNTNKMMANARTVQVSNNSFFPLND